MNFTLSPSPFYWTDNPFKNRFPHPPWPFFVKRDCPYALQGWGLWKMKMFVTFKEGDTAMAGVTTPREMRFAFHRASNNTESIPRIVLKRHFVQKLSVTQKWGKKGRFSKVSGLWCPHLRELRLMGHAKNTPWFGFHSASFYKQVRRRLILPGKTAQGCWSVADLTSCWNPI